MAWRGYQGLADRRRMSGLLTDASLIEARPGLDIPEVRQRWKQTLCASNEDEVRRMAAWRFPSLPKRATRK
jgi:hypothetical protein